MNVQIPQKVRTKPPHIINIAKVEKRFIGRVFDRARNMGHRETNDSLKGKSMCWISPPQSASTRTQLSFAAAIEDLGGCCRGLPENSSMKGKAESLRDTVRVVGTYHDVIVMRSTQEDPHEAAKWSPVSVINAGNGPDEHPTQAMMDAFTIIEHFEDLRALKIAIVGDLECSRSVRSFALLVAAHYPDNELTGVSPPELRMKEDVRGALQQAGVTYHETSQLGDVIDWADVVIMTRLQREHQRKGLWAVDYPCLTPELGKRISRHGLIMAPLPADRQRELPYEIDDLPQAVYLKQQLRAGPRVRKALLQELLLP